MERFVKRRERLRAALRSDDVDAFLVSSSTNVSYLTGFTGDASVLVLSREGDRIISDGRFTTQIEQECPGLDAEIRLPGQEMVPTIAGMVARMGIKRLAFEAGVLTVADHLSLASASSGVSMVGVEGWVEALRQIKDDEEIAAIRAAVRCAERAFTMLRAGLRESDSEKDAADALEGYLRHCGATCSSFPPIVAVGVRFGAASRPPHGDYAHRGRRFRSGRLGSGDAPL